MLYKIDRFLRQLSSNGHQVRQGRYSWLSLTVGAFIVGLFVHAQLIATDELKELSFYRGYILWTEQLDRPGIAYDFDKVVEGMRSAEARKPLAVDNHAELDLLVKKLQERVQEKQLVEHLTNAERFLALTKAETDTVEVRQDKLYYKILQQGNASGPGIVAGSSPLLTYSARVLELDSESGSEFHSMTEPTRISLPNTIPGFAQGVVGMRVGEQRRLFIHPDLAYGKDGGFVGPNRLMIFDVTH